MRRSTLLLQDCLSKSAHVSRAMVRCASAVLESLEVRRLLSSSDLDATFGTGGIVTAGIGDTETAFDMLIQPDGKILVAGTGGASPAQYGLLMRFNPDGTPDTSFDSDGRVEFISANTEIDAVTLDGSGNIVVAGTRTVSGDADLFVARFLPSGALDTSFASPFGWTTVGLGGTEGGRDVAVTGGGIVIAGTTTANGTDDFAVAKLTSAGALDTTFNSGGGLPGTLIQNFNAGSADTCEAMAVQSDGSLVLVGASNGDFAVLKLTGSGGFVVSTTTQPSLTGSGTLFGVTIGAGDSIIGTGTFSDTNDHFVVLKYDSSAVIDNNFDTDGIAEVAGGFAGADVIVDSAGDIVAVGFTTSFEFAVAKLDQATGAMETGFGTGGLVSTAIGTFAVATAVAEDSSGRLVVSGFTDNGTDFDFAVARYGDAPGGNVVTVEMDGPDLVITGTGDAESIVITKNTEGINVEVDGTTAGTGFNPTGRIVVMLGDGADQVNVASSITTPLYMDGGAGNDTIKGGNGHDILIGGPGDDHLMGSGGRDLMIGGTGADKLLGHNDDDIIIAASTVHDGNATALFAIHTEWTSSRSYAVRVNNIRDGSGSLLRDNGSFFFDAVSVVDDGVVDSLGGQAGSDWFIFNEGNDLVTDLNRNEFGDDIA